MSFLVIGTIFHTILGGALAFLMRTKWSGIYVALIFIAKEFGELKYKIPGSIKSWDKNWEIIQTLFTDLSVLMQWALPGLCAFGVYLYLDRKKEL